MPVTSVRNAATWFAALFTATLFVAATTSFTHVL